MALPSSTRKISHWGIIALFKAKGERKSRQSSRQKKAEIRQGSRVKLLYEDSLHVGKLLPVRPARSLMGPAEGFYLATNETTFNAW